MSKNQSVEIITLNDGRSIKDLTLMLDSRLTVFTGAMGSGKTSLLKALAQRTNAKKNLRWVFTNYDVAYRSHCVDISDVSDFDIIRSLSVDTSKPFTAYSKGEQAIVGLCWSIANELDSANANDRILVLIDDLGHDLHPIWQHKILPLLLKDFPTVQFVVTTTSPLVMTHVQPDSLFFVEKGDEKIEVWQATESYGKTAERILEDLQGLETTRPVEVQECLHQFYRYLDSGDLINAEKELAIAQDMTGHNIDPELTRMELRLRTESRHSDQNEINHNYTLGK